MTIRSYAMAFAFALLANAVSAETRPPASNSRQDAALEAFVAQGALTFPRRLFCQT